ncbi:MAG TPA: glycosyltransferase family 4 protein [Armatimonadota bacterium]|jgi:glycosyltransferase involved in cell wall biosynthesis
MRTDAPKPDDLARFPYLKDVLNRIEVAYIATYPPTECGIATFTQDSLTAVRKFTPFSHHLVVAMNYPGETQAYPDVVKFQVDKATPEDYDDAAKFINESSATVLHVQHEYGIFGGDHGDYIVRLMEQIKKPMVVTLHTVLAAPNPKQREIVEQMGRLANHLIVMIDMGRRILMDHYDVDPAKIVVIPHGVPNVRKRSSDAAKKSLGLTGHTVLSTFGLINRGKGLEHAIEAMAKAVENHPEALYLILGQTHPAVRKEHGEEYRNELNSLVSKYGLQRNVRFNNHYLTLEELVNYLSATDIYITPYLNKDQITSGTLAYALGCGKAIISTPYLYAEEMLGDGRGILVPFRDSDAIGDAFIRLLDDIPYRHKLETATYKYGRRTTWYNVAIEHLNLFYQLMNRVNGGQSPG